MYHSIPVLTIHVPRRGGRLLIQRYREHPTFKYSMQTGNPIPIDAEEMRARGLAVVREILADYPEQEELGDPPLQQMTAAERRKFVKDYIDISVTALPNEGLRFCVDELAESGGWGTGRIQDALTLPPSGNQEAFNEMLRAAIDQGQESRKPGLAGKEPE